MSMRGRLALVSAFAIVGCHDSVRLTDVDQSPAIGSYVLQAGSARDPAVGSIVLSPSNVADRRVRYRNGDGTLSAEEVTRGTFILREDNTLDLRFPATTPGSAYVWKPEATLNAGVLRLQYPHPADGIGVEVYNKQ